MKKWTDTVVKNKYLYLVGFVWVLLARAGVGDLQLLGWDLMHMPTYVLGEYLGSVVLMMIPFTIYWLITKKK
jgi:hypothetical protein